MPLSVTKHLSQSEAGRGSERFQVDKYSFFAAENVIANDSCLTQRGQRLIKRTAAVRQRKTESTWEVVKQGISVRSPDNFPSFSSEVHACILVVLALQCPLLAYCVKKTPLESAIRKPFRGPTSRLPTSAGKFIVSVMRQFTTLGFTRAGAVFRDELHGRPMPAWNGFTDRWLVTGCRDSEFKWKCVSPAKCKATGLCTACFVRVKAHNRVGNRSV